MPQVKSRPTKRKATTYRKSVKRAPPGVTQPGASVLAARAPSYVPRGIKSITDLHYFEKVIQKDSFVVGASAWQSGAWGFQLSDLPEMVNFQQLFDQFRITKIRLMFVPQFQNTDSGSLASPFTFFTTTDQNSIVPPASQLVMLENKTVKITPAIGRPFYHIVYPRVSAAVLYSGATVAAGETATGPMWINTSDQNVVHMGAKWGCSSFVTANTMTVNVFATYSLEFKHSQ